MTFAIAWPAALLGALFLLLADPQLTASQKDIPALARRSVKAVVLIVVSDKTGKEIGRGSGFVVSSDGKVVTNYHVIAGADSAIIKFPSGAFYLVEGVLAADQEKDIAVLKASGKDFSFLAMGDSDQVQIGEEVVAIGSPLGLLEATVSSGIVSGIREQGNLKFIQTTAPISPGSSGGALLNLKGDAIGITSEIYTKGQNLNLAVPVNYIKPLLAADRLSPLGREMQRKKAADISTGTTQIWTSLTTGQDHKIRVDGDFVYVESVLPETARSDGAFILCETKRDGDKWVGTCHARLLFSCLSRWAAAIGAVAGDEGAEAGRYEKWCSLEWGYVISSISPSRIEGEVATWEPKDFDCGTCQPKKGTRKAFALIPKK